jgi:hypothetical protein
LHWVSDTVVEAKTKGSGTTTDGDAAEIVVFRMTLTTPTVPATATIIYEQFAPVETDDNTKFDEQVELRALSGDDKLDIRWTTVAEDGDQDQDSGYADVSLITDTSSVLAVDDDGPIASVKTTGEEVVHDESAGLQNTGSPLYADAPDVGDEDNDDDDRDGSPTSPITTFENNEGGGLAASRLGWAQSPGAVVEPDTDNDFGTDGEAATNPIQYSLDIPAAGTASGIFVLSGAGVSLYKDATTGVIVGRVNDITGSVPGDPDPSGAVAFVVSIDATTGVISMAQYLAARHPDTTDDDDSVNINTDALLAVMTVKDGDDDVDVSSVAIGDKVRIEDDGPANGPTDPFLVDEDNIPSGQSKGIDEDDYAPGAETLAKGDVYTRTDNLVSSIISGRDGPATNLTFSLNAGTPAEKAAAEAALAAANLGLMSKGQAVKFDVGTVTDTITLYVEDGGDPSAFDNGTDRVVATLLVAANGDVTWTQIDQFDSSPAFERIEASNPGGIFNDDDQEEEVLVTMTPGLFVTDLDGDPVDLPLSFLQYIVEDDMPDIGDGGANVTDGGEDVVDNALIQFSSDGATYDITDTVSLEAVIGTDELAPADMAGAVTIVAGSFPAQIVYANPDPNNPTPALTLLSDLDATGQTLTYYKEVSANGQFDDGTDIKYFELTVNYNGGAADPDKWTYTWTSFQDLPIVEVPVLFDQIEPGAPVEILSPPIGATGLVANFDGLIMDGAGFVQWDWSPGTEHDVDEDNGVPYNGAVNIDDRPDGSGEDDETADNGNANNQGYGIKGATGTGNQSSQFNHNEGSLITVTDSGGVMQLFASVGWAVEGIGNVDHVNIDVIVIDENGTEHNLDKSFASLPSGNNEVQVDIDSSEIGGLQMLAVYFRTWFDADQDKDGNDVPDTNVGVRVLDFVIGVPGVLEDQTLDVDFRIEDFDLDYDIASTTLGIDGDLDGDVDGLGNVLPDA